jgi:hypothetical protein
MANKVEIEFISEGFEQILTSDGTMSAVQSAASEIRTRANANNTRGGSGFYSGTRIGKAYGSQRALGFVYTTDEKSARAESEDKALSGAVSG